MTRKEHIEWCKQRAREYVAQGDYKNAVMSMMSGLDKHPETANEAGKELGLGLLLFAGGMPSHTDTVNFIEGFQ